MAEEINKTADWAPGTLDKTRKNIGDISDKDAAAMAKKLGGQVMYERSSANSSPSQNKGGRIVRQQSSGGGSGSSSSSTPDFSGQKKRYQREQLPNVHKKVSTAIDKLMMSPEYKIKPNYGVFNFVRSWQKNGTEKILNEFYEYKIKQMLDHMEAFITVIKTLIQVAPATYKTKIANGTEPKFKFLRMVAGWTMQPIKIEYFNVQNAPQPLIVADLIPVTRAIYKPLITVYYYGNNKIPKLIKEIYTDEAAYPDSPQEKLSGFAKQAITEWLYLETEIIKKLYPLLLRMCSDTFEGYPTFFNTKAGEILKFVGLHKFDLLLPEKPKEPAPEQKVKKPEPPQKGVKDSNEFLTAIKTECNFDQIYVTTPKGDAIKLPEGATALDFAYAVHSDIGDKCMGVKVDGKIVPLDYKLKTGQKCEALVRKNIRPTEHWLSIAITAQAKSRIRKYLREHPKK